MDWVELAGLIITAATLVWKAAQTVSLLQHQTETLDRIDARLEVESAERKRSDERLQTRIDRIERKIDSDRPPPQLRRANGLEE